MKTRRFLGWVAMATMVLSTGCSSDEVVNDYSLENAIQFSTYMGRNVQSRAAELTTEGLKEKGFGVFAFYTGKKTWSEANPSTGATSTPNFMFNQQVTWNSGANTPAWEYSPVKYWPETKNDKISFFAYGPYLNYDQTPTNTVIPQGAEGVNANAKAGVPTVKFTQSIDAARMVDFVAGVAMDQTGSSDNYTTTESKTVEFKLKHELTRLNFGAKLDRDAFLADDAKHQTKINIKSVKIDVSDKFYASADYTFATNNDVTNGKTYRGTWSNHVKTTADLNLDGILNSAAVADMGGYVTPGILLSNDATGTGETVVPLFKQAVVADPTANPAVEAQPAQYLFLIPPVQQDGNTGLASSDVINVTFTYDIVTVDNKLSAGHIATEATKTVALPTGDSSANPVVANTLQQGQAYKFIFTFGLHEVKVSATVEDWATEGAGGGTDVDWTDTDANDSSTGSGDSDDGDANA